MKTTWYTEAACFYFWYQLDVVGKVPSFPKWSQAPTETMLLSWICPLQAASPQWPLVEALKVHFLSLLRACLSKTDLCSQDWSSESKTKAGVLDGASPKRWRELCCPCLNHSHSASAPLKSTSRRDFHPGQSKSVSYLQNQIERLKQDCK